MSTGAIFAIAWRTCLLLPRSFRQLIMAVIALGFLCLPVQLHALVDIVVAVLVEVPLDHFTYLFELIQPIRHNPLGLRLAGGKGQVEIAQHDVAVLTHQHILRLQIPIDEAVEMEILQPH